MMDHEQAISPHTLSPPCRHVLCRCSNRASGWYVGYYGSERGAILLSVALGKPAGAKSAWLIFYFPGPQRLSDGTFRPGQQQIITSTLGTYAGRKNDCSFLA